MKLRINFAASALFGEGGGGGERGFSSSIAAFRPAPLYRNSISLNVFAAIANLELEEAELLNRLRNTQEKQRLAYRCLKISNL